MLAIGREVLGEPWAQSHITDKKAALVGQLDRAFSDPEKSGRTPDQIEKLKRWLPDWHGVRHRRFPETGQGQESKESSLMNDRAGGNTRPFFGKDSPMTSRIDLYTRVTNAIIADLEQGVRPWLKPWNAEHAAGRITRPLRAGGQPYKGINVLMLWAAAMTQNFAAPIWMTFKQAKELDGQRPEGLQGLAGRLRRPHHQDRDRPQDGEESERDIYFMKGYTVFNVEQIEGLPPHFYAAAAPQIDPVQRIEAAEPFFANTGADIRHGGNQAYYAAEPDYVQMPPFVSFKDAESYYSTLAHEMTHWTKHPTRLNRDFGRKRVRRRGVRPRGTGRRDRGRVPLLRPRHHAGATRRPRRLSRPLAEAS